MAEVIKLVRPEDAGAPEGMLDIMLLEFRVGLDCEEKKFAITASYSEFDEETGDLELRSTKTIEFPAEEFISDSQDEERCVLLADKLSEGFSAYFSELMRNH